MTDVDRERVRVTVRAADPDVARTVLAGITVWWATTGCARLNAPEDEAAIPGASAEASIDLRIPAAAPLRASASIAGDPRAPLDAGHAPFPWSVPTMTVEMTEDALLEFPAESALVTSPSIERGRRVAATARAHIARLGRRRIAVAALLLTAGAAALLLLIALPATVADDTPPRPPVVNATNQTGTVTPNPAAPTAQGIRPAAAPTLAARVSQPALPTVPSPFPVARNRYTANLVVRSEPAGGTVAIDGVRIGVTPVRVRSLPVGSHAVHVTVDGHPLWSTAARVVYGRENQVVARFADVVSAAPVDGN